MRLLLKEKTVVVAYFGDLDDSVLLKSTDNGEYLE